MMNDRISNLIVFEIFASEHEYLRFCVYRVLMRFPGSKPRSKRESARHPCSTSLSVGNLLAATKLTVKITDSSQGKYAAKDCAPISLQNINSQKGNHVRKHN